MESTFSLIARRGAAFIDERRAIVAPLTRYHAAEYLNALYGGNFVKVRALDKSFSKPYREGLLGNLVNNLYGQSDRTNISDVVSAVRQIMSQMDCKRPIIRTLENNMIRYFDDYQRRSSG